MFEKMANNEETGLINLAAHVKKWVNPKSTGPLDTKEIKKLIKKEHPPLDASEVRSGKEDMPIKEIHGDNKQITGMLTFPILPFIQLPFLKALHDFNANENVANVIDLGGSDGRFSWKALLTGSKVVLNDLYKNQIEKARKFISKHMPNNIKNFDSVAGNLFTILEDSPRYKNHFNFVYAQNVAHFFNPAQCEKFAILIWDLLTPGGKAFITTQTFATITSLAQSEERDMPIEYMAKYKEHKKILEHIENNIAQDNIFPAFIELIYDSNRKLKNIRNSEDDELIAIKSTKRVHNFFTESTFALFSNIGFNVISITCGDRVGQEHDCYTKAEEGDQLTSMYIAAVLEKPVQDVTGNISLEEL